MITLTDDQKRAAEAEGCAAVTAGAGTGKTRMLAERYRYHVQVQGLSPLSVVAVTFTEKAAAELRARIRATLVSANCQETAIAEVEAAQISTIHALAARICRDFYDLAEIPPDFTVLDELDSPLWEAEKFAEALAEIDSIVSDELGFNWLVRVLPAMLADAAATEKALGLGADNWREALDNSRRTTIGELLCCEAWTEAANTIRECSGISGDTLEEIRSDLISAMDIAGADTGIDEVFTILKRFRSNSGSAKKWDPQQLERVRACLVALKTKVNAANEIASLSFGPEDEEAARRIPLLAQAFRSVRDHIAREKLREKVLDFNDLERYALKILAQPEAIQHYRLRWKAFLVDEFQDTNPIQAEILALLTKEATLTIVGDEKQSIYGFRGADVRVFSKFRAEIVEGRNGISVPLALTFRSHHELAQKVNKIFEPVLGELHQPLSAMRRDSKLAQPHIRCASVETEAKSSVEQRQVLEARYIAERIIELNRDRGIPFSEMAVIARRWAPLSVYGDVLSAFGIPAVNAGGGSLLQTREAQDVFALLSFLAEQADDIALITILRSPFFAFSDKTLYEAANLKTDESSWWTVIQDRPEFSRAAEVLKALILAARSASAEAVVRMADKATGYGAVTANLPQGRRRIADLNGIYELLRKLDCKGLVDVFSTQRHLRELYLMETDIPRQQLESGEAVTLMTIHKAKGLEWPIVFVPDLGSTQRGDSSPIVIDSELGIAFEMEGEEYEKAAPAIHKLIKLKKKAREAEEARRLLYVAVTRAKDAVFLTSGKAVGSDIEILRPGLDAAGIVDEIIPFDAEKAIAPAPGESPIDPLPERENTVRLKVPVSDLPVTALTVYSKCPKRFEYQYVDGHPGLGKGPSSGMEIGSLAHTALELDIDSAEELQKVAPVSAVEHVRSALDLASRFRNEDVYSAIRGSKYEREVPFTKTINGVTLSGVADLVGEDFVVDYKTDATMHPTEHRFQLWAYATALDKRKASIAYLRHGALFDFSEADLKNIASEAISLMKGLTTAAYHPTPSEISCGDCSYSEICESRFVG